MRLPEEYLNYRPDTSGPTIEDMAEYIRDNYLFEFLGYVKQVEPELIDNFVSGEKDFFEWWGS